MLQPPLFWSRPKSLTFGAFGIVVGKSTSLINVFTQTLLTIGLKVFFRTEEQSIPRVWVRFEIKTNVLARSVLPDIYFTHKILIHVLTEKKSEIPTYNAVISFAKWHHMTLSNVFCLLHMDGTKISFKQFIYHVKAP